MWRKVYGAEHYKSFEYTAFALVVFLLMGVIFQIPLAFVPVGVFAAYLIIYKVYDNQTGRQLAVKNPTKTVKLFPGEETVFTLEMENRSIFPMINGELQFKLGAAMKAYKHTRSDEDYWKQVNIPLSVLRKRKLRMEIPVIAEHRGTSRINNITYMFPHLFSFNTVSLKYQPFYRTEFVVFPKPLAIQGAEEVFHVFPGTARANLSPFEDIQSPLGTRDYNYSDPFHRINWKASVKTQGLQTNIYEKVVDMSYVFLVNLGTENRLHMSKFNENLENLLSYTAYLSQYATEKGFPYEIYINARRPGKIPGVHLEEGEGKAHYGNALEMLARIHKQSVITPFNELLYHAGKNFYNPKTIILIGELPAGSAEIVQSWKRVQHTVYQIQETDDGAFVQPMAREVMKYAE